jgi:hypothetical protein
MKCRTYDLIDLNTALDVKHVYYIEVERSVCAVVGWLVIFDRYPDILNVFFFY